MVMLGTAGTAKAGPGKEKLTMEQMHTKAGEMLASMRSMRDSGEAALRQARSNKDVGQLDSVNEALIALKGVLKLAEDYYYDLKAAFKDADAKAVQSSFVKIAMAAKKIADLDARIRSAGGPGTQGAEDDGTPIIDRTTDSDLPSQDPLQGLETEAVFVEKPTSVSPYD